MNFAVGDTVKSGETLADLAMNSVSQNVISAQSDLITAQRTLDNLRKSNVTKSQAQLKLAQAEKAYTDALDNRDSKDYKRADQSVIDSAQASMIIAKNDLDNAQTLFEQFVDRSETDVERAQALTRLSAAQQIYDQKKANLDYLLGAPDAQEIAESDAKVAVAKANLDDAQREWDRQKDGPNADDITAAEARLAAITATLDSINLEAPFNGTLTDVKSKVGDQVTPATTAFRVDDLSLLLVDVDIPEVDINRIQIEQKATLTFDAILGKDYEGKVTKVGRVGTPNQGVVNFTVTIEVTNPDADIRPGMTAAVNIIVNQLQDILIAPNRAFRTLNGQRVVYMLENNVPTSVKVEIGASSDTETQIVSGDVKAGDLLVLNPPTTPNFGGGPQGGGGMRMGR